MALSSYTVAQLHLLAARAELDARAAYRRLYQTRSMETASKYRKLAESCLQDAAEFKMLAAYASNPNTPAPKVKT